MPTVAAEWSRAAASAPTATFWGGLCLSLHTFRGGELCNHSCPPLHLNAVHILHYQTSENWRGGIKVLVDFF